MARAWLLALMCGACAGTPGAAAASSGALPVPAALEAAFARPRVLAVLDLRDARMRARLADLLPLLGGITGHAASDCKLAIDRLESVRVAVGEPFRVSAEI